MQVSRIEQKIEDIYAFVESCKMAYLSTTKVVVPKNELYDLLDDLRRDVPDEIKRYQKILNQRDAILEDAEEKANSILIDAKEQYKALVEEHSIMQQAYQQAEEMVSQARIEAQEIIDSAKKQANEIGTGAIYYTTDMLDMAEKVIASAYESAVSNSTALENTLRAHLETIRQNKAELVPSGSEAHVPTSEAAPVAEQDEMPEEELLPEEEY